MARKILLADDSVTAQNMGRRILSDAGYEVVTVNNGSAALKRIAESKPDLIVLDVYMPGYGGLEVCQRLRESRETARIPVLLTVGKLEPFKPEEARRVRADAFIVKPFEASELLTALTKLEDRIVPQPAPYKPGRFAKAISAIESDTSSNEYGDLESGWKNRLKIPVPQSYGPDVEEVEPQAQPVQSGKPEVRTDKEARSDKDPKPAVTPIAVPRDITPEEIAAIHAAAAAFGSQITEPVAGPETKSIAANEPAPQPEETKPTPVADAGDEVAATFASVAPVEEIQTTPAPAEVEHKSETPVAQEVRTEAAEVVASAIAETQAEQAPAEEAVGVAPTETISKKEEERDDFAVALESLGPANGHGVPKISGPRWTAELVAVTDAESALILEQEMQKAVAAMAAVSVVEAGQSAPEAPPPSAMGDTHQETAVTPSVTPAVGDSPELSTSLVAAMAETTSLPTLSDLVDSVLPQVSAETEAPESQGAAFAAAAAGSGDAISQSVLPAEMPPGTPAPGSEEDRQRESELAAAWESWKHIRESVVEPQLKPQTADAPAEMPSLQAEPASHPQAESGNEGGQEEAGAIASIVDSVLADLKPKLMEEISRKMGKDKKRR